MSNAWQYAENFDQPEVAKQLLQASLSAYLAIKEARKRTDELEILSGIGWKSVEQELLSALKAAGHPAGDSN